MWCLSDKVVVPTRLMLKIYTHLVTMDGRESDHMFVRLEAVAVMISKLLQAWEGRRTSRSRLAKNREASALSRSDNRRSSLRYNTLGDDNRT